MKSKIDSTSFSSLLCQSKTKNSAGFHLMDRIEYVSSKHLEFLFVHTINQMQAGFVFHELALPLSSPALLQHLKRSTVAPGLTIGTPPPPTKFRKSCHS